ncbi:MAG: enoyl-CoA hydratase/carnithine racemase [Neobacillus sp.]|nr:enoyl-CoA hydratase/carnithine racemase [Neobacillus sp.]
MSEKKQSNRKIFKFNEDDILEILSEYLAEEHGINLFRSKIMLKGEANKDIRMIAVIGDLEDEEISKLNLDDIDEVMDYNGSH